MGRPCCPRQTWMFHKSQHEKLLTNTGVRFLLNRPAGGSNTTATTKVTLWPQLYFPSRSKKMFLESCRTFPRKPNSLLSTVGEKQLLSGWKKPWFILFLLHISCSFPVETPSAKCDTFIMQWENWQQLPSMSTTSTYCRDLSQCWNKAELYYHVIPLWSTRWSRESALTSVL